MELEEIRLFGWMAFCRLKMGNDWKWSDAEKWMNQLDGKGGKLASISVGKNGDKQLQAIFRPPCK